jgi:opacity protein-like surface antigen
MIRKLCAIVLALALLPALVFADVETKGTVVKVDKAKKQLMVKTDKGEEGFVLGGNIKGEANAKEGTKVIIKYTEKDGQMRVTEIIPQEGGALEKKAR